MRGLLKSRSAGTQFLLLICITLVSSFIAGLAGTMILSAIMGIRMTELANMANWDFSDPARVTYLRGLMLVQFISLCLIPVFTCVRLFSINTKQYLGLRNPVNPGYYIAGFCIMLFALPLVSWLGEINRDVNFPSFIENWMRTKEDEAARTTQALLSHRTPKDLILNLIFVAVFAAVGEELLFRGMVQRLLIRIFKRPWAGILVAAFLFSAMHLQFYGFLPRFMLGIFLGLIYWYSGSMWAAILAHFIYDAVLIVLAYFNPEMIGEESAAEMSNVALMMILSLVIVSGIIVWMKARSVSTYHNMYGEDDLAVKDHPF